MIVLRGQIEELPGDVERVPVLRAYAVSQIGPPKDGHLFVKSASIAEQVAGMGEDPDSLFSRIAFHRGNRRSQSQIKIQFLACALRRGLQIADQFDSASQMLDGFGIRRTA